MRVVSFTGTKRGMSLRQKDAFCDALQLLKSKGFTKLVHGGCKGADELAHLIAHQLGWKLKVYPSTKKSWHGLLVGEFELMAEMPPLKRNLFIVDDCEVLIAAPQQDVEIIRSGTWTTVRYARKRKKQIIMLER